MALVEAADSPTWIKPALERLVAERREALRSLPAIASHEIPKQGSDRQEFAVIVRDEAGTPTYTATIGFSGVWLAR